ncbi:MAG: hypothetical protein JWM19_7728 [Actinomycetia bacterium]|nr:hypothetical protein [Actinomycetes bacterium]
MEPMTGPKYALSLPRVEATKKPAAISIRPAGTTILVPRRLASIGAAGAAAPTPMANGSVRTPAERGEAHQPDLEGTLAPVPVTQAPPTSSSDAKTSEYASTIHCGRRAELPADRGQGDVDDRVVDEREKNAQAQDGEYRPPPGMHRVGAGRRCPPRSQVPARPRQPGTTSGGAALEPDITRGLHRARNRTAAPAGDCGGRAKRSVLPSRVSQFAECPHGHGAPPGTGATLSMSLSVSPKTLLNGK